MHNTHNIIIITIVFVYYSSNTLIIYYAYKLVICILRVVCTTVLYAYWHTSYAY